MSERVAAVLITLAVNFALFSPGAVVRVRAADRALEIMREVDRRQHTESRSHDGAIEVTDAKGKVLHKSWQLWGQGHPGESKVLIRFTGPPEVRGVGLLTVNQPGRAAEQWLYTPSIQRDRRITAQEKSARFMGTDFSNEDMEERSVEDYDYKLVGDDTFETRPAYKIRAIYKDRDNTQYSHLLLWVRKDIMVTTFTEFYIQSEMRKTILWGDWQPVQGISTAHLVEVKDLARGSTTRVRVTKVKYNIPFPSDWFTLRNLRREF